MSTNYGGFKTIFNAILNRRGLLFGYAGIVALTIVLRHVFTKNTKLIQNLASIGRPANDERQIEDSTEEDLDDFDVIIIGGGELSRLDVRISHPPVHKELLAVFLQDGLARTLPYVYYSLKPAEGLFLWQFAF
jgi:hypothetical protein